MAHQKHQTCIEACVRCAQECEHCADSCLGESDVQAMAECIRLDRDCAEICWAAAAWMSRGSQFASALCRLCADVCDACGAECATHKVEHCQRCAEACRWCAKECRRMAAVTTRGRVRRRHVRLPVDLWLTGGPFISRRKQAVRTIGAADAASTSDGGSAVNRRDALKA